MLLNIYLLHYTEYSRNKITKTRIQISCSNISHQMIIPLSSIDQKASGINSKKYEICFKFKTTDNSNFDK
jgi:hypothetical protein